MNAEYQYGYEKPETLRRRVSSVSALRFAVPLVLVRHIHYINLSVASSRLAVSPPIPVCRTRHSGVSPD